MKKFILFFFLINKHECFKITNNKSKKNKIKRYNSEYDYYKILENNTKKYCCDCKFSLYNDWDISGRYLRCNKFVKKDIENDKRALSCVSYIFDNYRNIDFTSKKNNILYDFFELCKDCRKDENMCGYQGKLFEKN